MSRITLYHCPQTRSSGAMVLVEELGADVDVKVLDMKAGEQRAAAFLAINPMGKVPALLDGDALVTEQVAIFLFLADQFPEKGLAPAIGDPLRGPYLRWMAFYGSSFEPACVDRAMKREPGPQGMSPYGDYASALKTVTEQLARGPYLLGERFMRRRRALGDGSQLADDVRRRGEDAADRRLCRRVTSRPAFATVSAKDAES